MSDTYYQYKDVKVNIAHRLFNMEGWTVYGYKPDESDSMTDYYSPAYWDGIATKNGYTLVVDHSTAAEEYKREYTVYTEDNSENAEKIAKLSRMTQANGASASEEATARAAIEKLQAKKKAGEVTKIDYRPGHMANPPRCNWHIEKDGVIMDKGTGLLKFANVPDISQERYLKDWQDFNNLSREEWINKTTQQYIRYWNDTEERARSSAESAYNTATEKYKLLEQFNILINRFNTIAGGMVGNGGENGYTYEVRKVTKYKKVYKFQESQSGSFTPGQCFKLKHNFNYGCYAGLVYKFVSCFDGQCVRGQRVSLKSNKVLTGTANSANSFGYYAADGAEETHGRDKDKFMKWLESGAIVWGEVVEVMEPYEVEKTFKVDASGNDYKAPKAAKQETAGPAEETEINYIISEDIDTRDNSKIFVVKLSALASPEQFKAIREDMKSKGGYYSRFKRGFIFKEDPSQALNQAPQEETAEAVQEAQTEQPGPAAEASTEAPKTQEAPQEEQPEQIPTDAPKEPKKAFYGYTGPASEKFTPEELETLINGAQVISSDKWRKAAFFTVDHKNNIKFVYCVPVGDDLEKLPNNNADFCGLIYNDKFYNDFELIINEMREDINAELLRQIPTEEAAERNAVELDSYQQNEIKFALEHDYTNDAHRHFIEDTEPELYVYKTSDRITTIDAINYLLDPAAVVSDFVKAYRRKGRTDIYRAFINYNRTAAALKAIKNDQSNPAHMLKQIKEATADETQKSYKVTLTSGHTIKVEARAVRRMPYSGDISKYYVQCSDRQYLKQDSYGRPEDIQPDEIVTISHGSKILYKKSA